MSNWNNFKSNSAKLMQDAQDAILKTTIKTTEDLMDLYINEFESAYKNVYLLNIVAHTLNSRIRNLEIKPDEQIKKYLNITPEQDFYENLNFETKLAILNKFNPMLFITTMNMYLINSPLNSDEQKEFLQKINKISNSISDKLNYNLLIPYESALFRNNHNIINHEFGKIYDKVKNKKNISVDFLTSQPIENLKIMVEQMSNEELNQLIKNIKPLVNEQIKLKNPSHYFFDLVHSLDKSLFLSVSNETLPKLQNEITRLRDKYIEQDNKRLKNFNL